jgi:hypothetical protein
MNATDTSNAGPKMASMVQLIEVILPPILQPVPSKYSLKEMFDKGNVRRFKASPGSRRGGGTVFYVVSDVERVIRNRITRAPVKQMAGASQ